MTTLTITRGLPASGKSTWAENWQKRGENRLVIGRDFIRLQMLHLGTTKGTHDQEDMVTAMQRSMVTKALQKGWHVVVDDTNLPLSRCKDWADLAASCNADFGVEDFTWVPLVECLTRNAFRLAPKQVPAAVIEDMHKRYLNGQTPPVIAARAIAPVQQYVPDYSLPNAYIFDIDGTCAKMVDRGPFEWNKVGNDEVHPWVKNIAICLYYMGISVVYLSGRDAICRSITQQWLDSNGFPPGPLFMRAQKDMRKDSVIKGEIFFEQIAEIYNVEGVFDDRNQVVDFWRSIGVPCAQVAPGDF